jgi:hypothetical protein
VVILMHGCTGLTEVVTRWAREKEKTFLGKGIGVLVLDSFGPRDIKRTCWRSHLSLGMAACRRCILSSRVANRQQAGGS